MDEGGSRCTSMVLSIFVELVGAEGGQLLILVLLALITVCLIVAGGLVYSNNAEWRILN